MRSHCADLVQRLCLHPAGNGLAHSACQTLVGTEIYIVGAGIARPFFYGFLRSFRSGRRKRCISAVFYAFVLNRSSTMRAGNARPYELKSVPTKTVAIRTTGNCSILVQNLRRTMPSPQVEGAGAAGG